VQLKKRRAQIRESLAAVSASLLAATIVSHADNAGAQPYDSVDDNYGPGTAYTQLDSALLIYKEPGGRVSAIEPATDFSVHGAAGQQLSLGFVFDAVSGATPNGAVPSNLPQIFLTPLKAVGSTTTVTTASGGSTVIHLPPTQGQIDAAALGRQYIVPANVLPMDRGFRDHRWAFTFGWSQPVGRISELGFGGGFSTERDYRAISLNMRAAQNFNSNNTTISFSLNGEFDSSFPFGGVPTPLTTMSAVWKSPSSRDKTQTGFVLGLTEVMTRRWLMQLNYSFDTQNGYQNDPYRVISLVDPQSGTPTSNIYENRPNQRLSQSIYWDNKFNYGPTVTEFSLRYFTDSWGISSETAELSERIHLGRRLYVEPNVRWYQQTAANFYRYYLVSGTPLPADATSDPRLGQFTSLTYGGKIGFNLTGNMELYLRGEYYQQTGNSHPANAVGQLRQQNLFAGTNATFGLIGLTWDFR
jgi:hypothetical protein